MSDIYRSFPPLALFIYPAESSDGPEPEEPRRLWGSEEDSGCPVLSSVPWNCVLLLKELTFPAPDLTLWKVDHKGYRLGKQSQGSTLLCESSLFESRTF